MHVDEPSFFLGAVLVAHKAELGVYLVAHADLFEAFLLARAVVAALDGGRVCFSSHGGS